MQNWTGTQESAHHVAANDQAEPEEEATGEAMVTEEVGPVGEPVAEAVVDEDAIMQDVLEAVPMAEVGPLADATRMSPMDMVEALLGIWSDGTICGYLKTSLAETAWQTLQETHNLPSVGEVGSGLVISPRM